MKKWYEEPADHADVTSGTFISLSRNLNGVPFPSRMSRLDRSKVWEQIRKALSADQGAAEKEFIAVDLETISQLEAISLAERGLISAEMASDREGRGLLMLEDESLSVSVNGEDHFTIQAKAVGMRLREVYSAADALDTLLDRSLPVAFDARWGYLTQNPFRLGTGMIASLRLHLPALMKSGSAGRIAKNLSKLGLSLYGFYGPELKPRGAFYCLSNQVTLGLSEREALSNLYSMANQIISREREVRKSLIRELSVQDSILRHLGVLQNARLLTFNEFLERIGAIRFGIVSGLLGGIPLHEIDTLIYRMQPATLAVEAGNALTGDERQQLRARIVRKTLRQGREDV